MVQDQDQNCLILNMKNACAAIPIFITGQKKAEKKIIRVLKMDNNSIIYDKQDTQNEAVSHRALQCDTNLSRQCAGNHNIAFLIARCVCMMI